MKKVYICVLPLELASHPTRLIPPNSSKSKLNTLLLNTFGLACTHLGFAHGQNLELAKAIEAKAEARMA